MLKYCFNRNTLFNNNNTASTQTYISVPINLDFDRQDTDLTNFIEETAQSVINQPVDNEKVKFTPTFISTQSSSTYTPPINFVDKIIYSLNLFNVNNVYGNKLSDIKFEDSDVAYRKQNLTNSFLRISFYDTELTVNQGSPQTLITLYFKVIDPTQPSNLINISFESIKQKEGYCVYYYKNDLLPSTLYAHFDFMNAKFGYITKLCTNDCITNPLTISNFTPTLHMKYNLIRSSTNGYTYQLDSSYSNNFSYSNNILTINLYELKV